MSILLGENSLQIAMSVPYIYIYMIDELVTIGLYLDLASFFVPSLIILEPSLVLGN
ncbi:hypothetical protein RchiOBHm_Chr7g0214891 [Rosa chinensis]|uniref:Uncharacterized protein n=1 Tax=Rosa chinensis TaxID=74649 RepID=A0A2P6PBC1_ROSCH|nr:hypothetical protein RchiOBHm_Chr7g0214891 [Rosa chinensis]